MTTGQREELPAGSGTVYTLRHTMPGHLPEPSGQYPTPEAAMLAATGTAAASDWYADTAAPRDCIHHMAADNPAGLFADWEISGPGASTVLAPAAGAAQP